MTTPEERRQAAVDRVAARRSEKPETVVETVAPDSERLDVIDERLVVEAPTFDERLAALETRVVDIVERLERLETQETVTGLGRRQRPR